MSSFNPLNDSWMHKIGHDVMNDVNKTPLNPTDIIINTDLGVGNNNTSQLKFPQFSNTTQKSELLIKPLSPSVILKDYFKPPQGSQRSVGYNKLGILSDLSSDHTAPLEQLGTIGHQDYGNRIENELASEETIPEKMGHQNSGIETESVLTSQQKRPEKVGHHDSGIGSERGSCSDCGGNGINKFTINIENIEDIESMQEVFVVDLESNGASSNCVEPTEMSSEIFTNESLNPRSARGEGTHFQPALTPNGKKKLATVGSTRFKIDPALPFQPHTLHSNSGQNSPSSPQRSKENHLNVNKDLSALLDKYKGLTLDQRRSERTKRNSKSQDQFDRDIKTSGESSPSADTKSVKENLMSRIIEYNATKTPPASSVITTKRLPSSSTAEDTVNVRPLSDGAVLSKLIDMIHDEFAFDGYLEDGVEDVNMAEYVQSLSGMSEEMFRESITDQYSDLYWDEDLLHQMYQIVQRHITKLRDKTPGHTDHSSSPSSTNPRGSMPSNGNHMAKTLHISDSSKDEMKSSKQASNSTTNMSANLIKDIVPLNVAVSAKQCSPLTQNDVVLIHSQRTLECKENSSPLPSDKHHLDPSVDTSLDTSITSSVDSSFNSSIERRTTSSLTPRESFADSDVTSIDSGYYYTGSIISRSSSEQSSSCDHYSWVNSDYTEVLPLKTTANKDLLNDVTYIYERYQEYMGLKLSSSADEVMENLGAKIKELDQQIILERRSKKKNKISINKLADSENPRAKDLLAKLQNDFMESDRKIMFLKQTKRQLKNVYAERFGLDPTLLHSFIESFGRGHATPLVPQRKSVHLSFSPLWDKQAEDVEDYSDFTRGSTLVNGSVLGLCAYLFARHAMTQGYVRYFLFTFRYCTTAEELLAFIADKFNTAVSLNEYGEQSLEQVQIQYRVMDILGDWIELTYERDFQPNPELQYRLIELIKEKIIPADRTNQGYKLFHMVNVRQRSDFTADDEEQVNDTGLKRIDESPLVSRLHHRVAIPTAPQEHRRISRHRALQAQFETLQCFGQTGEPQDVGETVAYKLNMLASGIAITDHASHVIAEQLTTIQQDLFSHLTPIHFLNSLALGAGVARTSPSKTSEATRQNMFGFNAGFRSTEEQSSQANGDTSLFSGAYQSDGWLEALLAHDQDMSTWISAEICVCPSAKVQVALISRLVNIAKYCHELRNYATFVQILDALDTFVVKQLPVWRQVPAKTSEILEALTRVKVMLKTDHMCLLRDGIHTEKATLPSLLYFLMHVQQLELGGFTLANGMFKWNKMRSIAKLVDQVRMFKQIKYSLARNPEIQEGIKQRLQQMRHQDLQTLASENPVNSYYNQRGRTGRFRSTLRKVKSTLSGTKSDS